jgi:hypothetical protein
MNFQKLIEEVCMLLMHFSPEFDVRNFFQILVDEIGEENARLYEQAFQLLTGIDHQNWLFQNLMSFSSMFYANISISSWLSISQIDEKYGFGEIIGPHFAHGNHPLTNSYNIFLKTFEYPCCIPAGSRTKCENTYFGRDIPINMTGLPCIEYFFATTCLQCKNNKDKRRNGCKHVRRGDLRYIQDRIYLMIPKSIRRSLFQLFAYQYAQLLLSSMIRNQPFLSDLHNAFIAFRQIQLLRKIHGRRPFPAFKKWTMPILPGIFLEMFPRLQKFFKRLELSSTGNKQNESILILNDILNQTSRPDRKKAMISGAMSLLISKRLGIPEFEISNYITSLVFKRVCSGIAAKNSESFSSENQKEFCTEILRVLESFNNSEMNDLLIRIFQKISVNIPEPAPAPASLFSQ